MGKVNDDNVSMVKIYFAIKSLNKRAEATSDGILRLFLDNTDVNPRDLWRKIKKHLNLGLMANIFAYSNGQYRIADEQEDADVSADDADGDADADADAKPDAEYPVSASNSAHSSRGSSGDARADGSTTSVATPPAADQSGRVRGYCNATREEREKQQCLIRKGLQQHYASMKDRHVPQAQKRRKVIRRKRGPASSKNHPRRSSGIRRTLPNPRRRRSAALAVTTRHCRCDSYVACDARAGKEKAVIDRKTREMTSLPRVASNGAVDRRDIFNERLEIDFSPRKKNSGSDPPPSSSNSDVSSASSKRSDVSTKEKRTEEDTLVYTSKSKKSPITPNKLKRSRGNSRNREQSPKKTTQIKKTGETTYQQTSRKSLQKKCCQHTGTQIVESMDMEDLVTVVNNPRKKSSSKKVNREKRPRSGSSKNKRVSVQTNLLNIPPQYPHGRDWSDSEDEDYVPLKKFRR